MFLSWHVHFAILMLNMFYMNNVVVLKMCFSRISESIVKFREHLVTDKPHLLRRVYHAQMNPVLLRKLKALRKQHLEVSEVVGLYNDTFNYELVATLMLTFLNVTFSFYVYLEIDIDNGKIKTLWSPPIIITIHHGAKMIMMVWACEAVKTAIREIGSNLHRVLLITFDEPIISEVINKIINGECIQT